MLIDEARHNAYLRSSGLSQSPFPQAFDAPLSPDKVHTLAHGFIIGCPASNPTFPVKAFPSLMLDSSTPAPVRTSSTITLGTAAGYALRPPTGKEEDLWAAWIGISGPMFVKAKMNTDGTKFTVVVPPGFHGQSYVVLTACNTTVNDDTALLGPALVEIAGTNGIP